MCRSISPKYWATVGCVKEEGNIGGDDGDDKDADGAGGLTRLGSRLSKQSK